jgi:hypothetical protein
MREVPDTRGLLGKAGGAALDLGKSALQVGSNFIQGPTGSRLLRNMALNGLDHFNPGEDSKFRYLKKAADLTDFSKVLREQIGDENAVLQHQRALESYKREAEMSAAKYDAHKARRQRMEKEADEIVSAREETRKRIEERLQQMETQIKDGKLKKAEALKAIGTVFGSAAKWALKIGGAAAGVVVGAGGTAASLGTATPAAAAAGASLALLLNTLGDAAGEFFPNVASAAKDWVTNLPEKEREAIEKLRQHQLEPDPTRGQIYRKLRSEAKERKHKKKTATS